MTNYEVTVKIPAYGEKPERVFVTTEKNTKFSVVARNAAQAFVGKEFPNQREARVLGKSEVVIITVKRLPRVRTKKVKPVEAKAESAPVAAPDPVTA